MDEGQEKILAAFLRAKRESFHPSPDFDDRVMAAVRASTQVGRAGNGGEQPVRARWRKIRKTSILDYWMEIFRRWLATPGRRALFAPAGLALLAAAYLAVMPGSFRFRQGAMQGLPEGGESTRIKGGAFRFALVIKERREGGDGLRRLQDGERLKSGDRIQALYSLSDSAYVELLSLDEQGKTQCYSCGTAAAKYPPGLGLPLPFALELDASPGAELFVLVASAQRRGAGVLRTALEKQWKAAAGDLRAAAEKLEREDSGGRFKCFLIRKGERT